MQVQITFEDRPIFQAPLAVLGHLYYYTVQYGLSVNQFTGAHWRDWEKLPGRLRKAQHDAEALEAIIAELERLAEGSEERRKLRQAQKESKWAEKEIVLNAQLLSVLGALPGELLALGVRNLTGCEDMDRAYRIVELKMQGPAGERVDFVEPDLLLFGQCHLLMVEVKTAGTSKSHKYRPNQLLNYLQLVDACRQAEDASLPTRFAHLILVPSTESKWLVKHTEWILDTCDTEGRLRVDPDACIRLGKDKAEYDYGRLRQLATEIPIYYRSWQQLDKAFELAIQQFGDEQNLEHWQRIGSEVKELAQRAGKYK